MEETVKILLVDDDEVDRMAVKRSLRAADVQMHLSEVGTCAEAIALLQQQEFDCVFLDYLLPDGNGLNLVQQVRALNISVPLIILTGQGDEHIAVQVMKAGAYDYLSKSKLSADNLSQILRHAIRVHQAETQAAIANQKLKESEERYRLVLEGSNDGIWDWYCATDEVYCNDRLLEIIGVSRSQFNFTPIAFIELIHPEDLPRVQAILSAHIARDEKCEAEFRLRHASGEYRYCIARGKALRDRWGCPTRLSGIISDITAKKQSEAEIVKLNRDLERRINELETLLDVIPIGIAIAQDPECRQIRVNPNFARILELPSDSNASKGAPLEEQPGYKVYQKGKELTAAELPMQHAALTGKEVLDVELDLVVRQDGSIVKLLGNAAPLFDEQGKTRGSVGAFIDITERYRVEEQGRFLSEASSLLATSLEYQTTLETLARLAVPQLADYCVIYVIEEDQSLSLVAVASVEANNEKLLLDLHRRYPINFNSSWGVPQVLRTGKSEFFPQFSQLPAKVTAKDNEHLQIWNSLGIKSLIFVPMKARGRILGVISFGLAASHRTYSQTDLTLAEELANRAALAVDNARLYQEATDIGENLRQAIIILGEQQQQLRALQRITTLLNQRLTNLPGLLQVMVGAVCDAISEAQFCLIELYNPQTQQLELTATSGNDVDRLQQQQQFNAEAGLLGQVFWQGKSQLFIRKSNRLDAKSAAKLPATIYAVAIESALAGRLGVLAIGNWENPAAFDVEDQNLLQAVGEQAAIAINNARLINTLEEREERLAIQNFILAQQNRDLELTRQQIEQQNRQLLAAAQLKSQFLATMSHELRTPMNAVIGFAQVLLRQRTAPLGAAQVDMVERILNNGKNLLALINDILDFSKIEAGRLTLQLEEINLNKLVLTTIAELRPLAEQKHLVLQVDAALDNPQIVNDSTRLRQILVNLISNGIKFTEHGSVEVKVVELSPTRIMLAVHDTGIGIAQTDVNHIFEEFRQLDQTTKRKYPGTGLGLAITKSLVQMMKGTIVVESQLGQGSIFRVELPRRVGEITN